MSTWVVQVAIVALFALSSGLLAAAWRRGRLGVAAVTLLVAAGAVWALALAAVATEYRSADGFATCDSDCTTVHYLSAIAFLAPPLLISLSGLAMIIALGRRWLVRRALTQEDRG